MSTITKKRAPRVLITNDDGPPSINSSPFVYPFAHALMKQLDWEVKVVVPSTQKSWVGNSYLISQVTTGQYYYPLKPSGLEGERSDLPRPLKEGEELEFILIDSTPATCTNLGLYSLYPKNSFDLVISGPNYGRNTSTAFGLSSGTIGCAMSAGLSGMPAIALSFGLMEGYKPPSEELVDGAITAAVNVCKNLWELGWGGDDVEGKERVDVYSVNVPILPSVLEKGGPPVQFTTMARTNYQRLFKSVSKPPSVVTDEGGPSAIPELQDEFKVLPREPNSLLSEEHHTQPLKFVFSPDIGSLLNPSPSTLMVGSDTHALHSGAISITPLRAAFEPVGAPNGLSNNPGSNWKL